MAERGGAPRVPAGFRLARVRVTPGAIALLLAAGVLALVARNLFVAAHRQLGWAFGSVVVAALLVPVTGYLERYIPRWLALLTTMVSLAVLTTLVWAAIVVNLGDGFTKLETEAPEAAARLEVKYRAARQFRLVERVNSLIQQFHKPTSTGATVGKAVGAAGTYFVCGILTLFILVYGPRMLRGLLGQISDPRRRLRVERTVERTVSRARGYILAAVMQAAVVGIVVGVVAWGLTVPAPFVLGTVTGTIGLIPTLGIVVGGLPALLVAAGLNGWRDALVLAAVILALQALEAHVVRPRVDRVTVHVGPALPAIVALIGYGIYGIGGALYGAAGLVFFMAWMDSVGLDDSPAPGHDTSEL